MLLLENIHPALLNAIERMISGDNVVPHCAVRDFDGTEYLVAVESAEPPSTNDELDEKRQAFKISVSVKHSVPFSALNHHSNFADVVSSFFPRTCTLAFPPSSPHCVQLTVPVGLQGPQRDEILSLAAQLRAMCYVPLFRKQFELFLAKPESMPSVRIPYHANESIFLYSCKGNFMCVISLALEGRDEQVFIRNFLQTFVDAKRLQKEIAGAPAFFFTQGKPPADLPSSLGGCLPEENAFYCGFQLFKLQMEKEVNAVATVRQLVNFRNTLMYHIHCCRSYMHALMRKRVASAMLVIKRAKTTTTGRARVTIK